jgi:uncharacterized protein (DUF934 family)
MTLINLSGIHSETFRPLADGEMPETGESIIVPFSRIQESGDEIFALTSSVGVIIETETPYGDIGDFADKITFADIRFPVFGDGRGFSLAVRLRKDFGFKGEIRASGHVLPDQALFLLRAGFDSVDAPEERREAFEAALKRFGAFYQTDMIGHGKSVAHLRHSGSNESNSSNGTREAS